MVEGVGQLKEGPIPYGYERVPVQVVPNKREQKAIAKMLKMHEQNYSLGQIARWLDTNGYPPRRTEKWTPQSVRKVIERELNRVD
jgi:hypothetical protein